MGTVGKDSQYGSDKECTRLSMCSAKQPDSPSRCFLLKVSVELPFEFSLSNGDHAYPFSAGKKLRMEPMLRGTVHSRDLAIETEEGHRTLHD